MLAIQLASRCFTIRTGKAFSESTAAGNGAFLLAADPNGPRIIALSPDGKRGACISVYSDSGVVLFNVDNPQTSAHRIFARVTDNPRSVAWIDETHLAIMEFRRGACPYYDHAAHAAPTNLAIIDVHGRLVSRGRCMAGVIAGPRDLICIQYFRDNAVVAFFDAILHRAIASQYFSEDYGEHWRRGAPAFQDGNGVIYYWPDYANDGTLVDDSGRVVATNTYDADWSKK